MKSVASSVKHAVIAAGAAGGVAFVQSLEVFGAAEFANEPWWAIAAAVATFLVAELQKLEGDEKNKE
ncbi:MAG: hypothetical protein OXG72_00080 [Acidobacteria bacterium]|nr:hypothetical protein [Acidobacteriota bacterium]